MISFYIALLLIVQFVELSEGSNISDYQDCPNSRSVLLKALFKTEDNLFKLDKVFAPERAQTSRYIKVTYTFLDSDDLEEGNCSVTYIWALGGFLLIQPPTVFKFSSLFFSRPSNPLEYLNLTLPYECRPLVMDNNSNCTCDGNTLNVLDRLTQQLNEYTKYNDPNQVVQDISSNAQAVCEEEVKERFFSNPKIDTFLAFTVTIPVITMVIIAVVVRSIHPTLDKKLTKSPENHPNLVGFTLAGSCFMVFVLVLDCIAVHHYRVNDHEYSDIPDINKNKFNLFIICVTLSTDLAVAILIFLPFMLYLTCTEISCCYNTRYCIVTSIVRCCILPYFYFIFGSKKLAQVWEIRNAGKEVSLTAECTAKLTAKQQAILSTNQQATLKEDCKVILTASQKAKSDNCTVALEAGMQVTVNANEPVILSSGSVLILPASCEAKFSAGQKVTIQQQQQQQEQQQEEQQQEQHDQQQQQQHQQQQQQQEIRGLRGVISLKNSQIEVTLNAGQQFTLNNNGFSLILKGKKEAILKAGQKIMDNKNKEVILLQQATATSTEDIKLMLTSPKLIISTGQEHSINQRTIWIVTGLMFAPLFSIASHSGYILAAWVTEPAKTTAAFLVALGSFLFMFFTFRQCYKVYRDDSTELFASCNCFKSDTEDDQELSYDCCRKENILCWNSDLWRSCLEDLSSFCGCCCKWSKVKCQELCCRCKKYWIYCLLFFPFWACCSHFANCCCVVFQICSFREPKRDIEREDKVTEFSIRGFFLSCSWGLLIVGVLALVLSAFYLLPLPTYQLAEYLEAAIQIIIVVLAVLVTYKVFTADDADEKIKKYFDGFRLKNKHAFVDEEAVPIESEA